MTDRAAPGAQGSTVRNMEFGEMSGRAISGYIQPSNDPTLSAQRWDELDETAFDEFGATYSDSSLTVTIQPGEGFANGWFATDDTHEVSLEEDVSGQVVVVGWDVDAVYSSDVHTSREDSDRVFVGLESVAENNVIPYIPIWEFDTDGDGVTSATDRRETKPDASFSSVEADELQRTIWVDATEATDSEINEALDDVGAAGGGVVRLTEGTVTADHIEITHSNTWLVGQGYNTLLDGEGSTNEPGFVDIVGEEGNRITNSGVANLRVENGQNENIEFDETDDCHAFFVWSGGAGGEHGDGIDFDNGARCSAMFCFTYQNGQDGIHISFDTEGCLASHCISYQDGQEASSTWGGFGLNSSTGNRIENCISIESAQNAFQINSSTYSAITDCTAIRPADTGAQLSGDASHNKVDVDVIEPGANGLDSRSDAGPHNKLSGYVEDAGERGVQVASARTRVTDVNVEGASDRAIYIGADNSDLTEFYAEREREGGGTAIVEVAGSNCKIDDGEILGGDAGEEDRGLRLVGDNNRAHNVNIRRNDGTGEAIFVDGDNNIARDIYVEDWYRYFRTLDDTEDFVIEIGSLDLFGFDDEGVRTVINGWGQNDGDPSSTGDWSGHGREGVNVYDTTNGVKYSYVNGDWR